MPFAQHVIVRSENANSNGGRLFEGSEIGDRSYRKATTTLSQ